MREPNPASMISVHQPLLLLDGLKYELLLPRSVE